MLQLFEFLQPLNIASRSWYLNKSNWQIIGVLYFILALVFFFIFWKKNKKKNADQILQEDIDLMISHNQSTEVSKKNIYYFFVASLKTFLKNKLQINFDSKTDEELIELLESKLISPTLISELKKILLRAHDIRFSSKKITESSIKEDIEWLKSLQKNINEEFLAQKKIK